MSVQWGFLKFNADAQKCYDEVQTLGEKYTPRDILELARDPNTELHKCFDWDDTSAAEKWRIQQARKLCGSFIVTVERGHSEPQKFRVIQHDNADKVYRNVVFTVRNEDEYGRLLKQAKAELAQFRSRYKSITELESVIDEIEILLAE